MSIQTLTTYLQSFSPPALCEAAPVANVRVEPLAEPTIALYRSLYRAVGDGYCWVDRLLMPEDELMTILADPGVSIFVLKVGTETAGFCELDCRQRNEVELAYFGLFQKFIGQGLGRFFLNWTLHQAWSYSPDRVWVHTCDLDHPAALSTYLRAGLDIYRQEVGTQRTLKELRL